MNVHTHAHPEDNPFAGKLGEDYAFLLKICPNAAILTRKLGAFVGAWPVAGPLTGFEIGCGSGLSTLALLRGRPDLRLTAVDSAGVMLDQAREHLADFVAAGRVNFVEADALDALRRQGDASLDVVASNYALHNFHDDRRRLTLAEVFRALKPGGLFVNGDRYAVDDRAAHLALTQATVRGWFKTFSAIGRVDLLEEWVAHFFSDESPDHIMPLSPALAFMSSLGFQNARVHFRDGVDTLVSAVRP